MNNKFTQPLLVAAWLRHRHGHVILRVYVSARLQFHTELSTVRVSAEISVCLCLDLQMSHSLCHIMLKRETLSGSKAISGYLCSPQTHPDCALMIFYLSLPSSFPYLSPSLFVHCCQTALSSLQYSALKIFQVALRRSRLLLHANVLCFTLEDKHKSCVWNHSQFSA